MADAAPKADRPLPDVPLIFRPEVERAGGGLELAPIDAPTRVLIVDDEVPVLNVVARALGNDNYDIRTAGSGEEALRLIDADGAAGIDLLITDLRMPGMSGRELAAALRTRFPDLRVLYQTGFADTLFSGSPELGAHEAFLEKPFSTDGLREAARLIMFGHISRSAAPQDERETRDWEDRRLRAKLVRLLRRVGLA